MGKNFSNEAVDADLEKEIIYENIDSLLHEEDKFVQDEYHGKVIDSDEWILEKASTDETYNDHEGNIMNKEEDMFVQNEDREKVVDSDDWIPEKTYKDETIGAYNDHDENNMNIEVLDELQNDHLEKDDNTVVEADEDVDVEENEDEELEVAIQFEVKNTTSVLLTGTIVLLILLARRNKSRN